jgi:hypothetical protein
MVAPPLSLVRTRLRGSRVVQRFGDVRLLGARKHSIRFSRRTSAMWRRARHMLDLRREDIQRRATRNSVPVSRSSISTAWRCSWPTGGGTLRQRRIRSTKLFDQLRRHQTPEQEGNLRQTAGSCRATEGTKPRARKPSVDTARRRGGVSRRRPRVPRGWRKQALAKRDTNEGRSKAAVHEATAGCGRRSTEAEVAGAKVEAFTRSAALRDQPLARPLAHSEQPLVPSVSRPARRMAKDTAEVTLFQTILRVRPPGRR